MKRADQTVGDRMPGADAIKSMVPGRFIERLALFVDGKTVGELRMKPAGVPVRPGRAKRGGRSPPGGLSSG
jgi:hypothetical protein